MANITVSDSVAALPRPALIRQWMVQFRVPAIGIGLITGNRNIQVKIYGELSKGITAPQNAIWGSRKLTDAVSLLLDDSSEPLPPAFFTNLFTKLGMTDTVLGDPIKVLSRMARPHNKRDGIYVLKPYDTSQHLFTTVNDFCKLLVHINQRAETAAKLTPATDGLDGWGYLTQPEGLIHRASGNGASHTILLFPKQKQAMVIFTNSDNGDQLTNAVIGQFCPEWCLI